MFPAPKARAATVAQTDALRFQGVVDRFDAALGLMGWCVDLINPAAPVDLELVLDGLAIARAQTSMPRADVCERLGVEGRLGFAFEAEIFERLLVHRPHLADRRVNVRIAQTKFALAQTDGDLELDAVFETLQALRVRDESEIFMDRLRSLRQAAESLAAAPFRATQAPACGYIETLALGSNGVLWFVGWARRDVAREISAVILDRQRFRAGAIAAAFERDDLASEAIGLVGALLTDWRPSASREAILLIGERADEHLRTVQSLRLSSLQDVVATLARAASGDDALSAQRLIAFSQSNDGFETEPDAAGSTKVAIDSARALDGFGVFMRGWIYSPARSAKRLVLKLGDRQFEVDSESLSFSPRPDLKSAFPAGRAIDRAGFCCVFEMQTTTPVACEPRLRIEYDDGSLSHHRLADLVIDKIWPDDEGGGFRQFFPNMERLSLFAGYAEAYYARCEQLYRDCRFESLQNAPIQLIFSAPRETHRLFLLFEELRENLSRSQAKGVGVVVIAGETARHGPIRELFHSLGADFAGACSLGFVEDVRFALWSLDSALFALAAQRFVYLDADVVLNRTGWEAIAAWLGAEPALAFLELRDPGEPWLDIEPSLQAFAWTSEAFVDWRRCRRLPIGAAPTAAGVDADRRRDCGMLAARAAPSAILAAINRRAGAQQQMTL